MNPAATEFLKQSGKVGGNVLSNALAYSLATHGDKAIGRGLQMAGDLAGLFFGLGSPGPTGPNLAEGQTAVGIPGALGDAAFNALTGEVVPTAREGGYLGKKGEAVKTWAAPEGSSKPYLSAVKKVAENPDSFMGGIAQSMYDNPEVVANAVRYGTPAVGLGAAALGLHMASKPRSDYALAVQGNPHLGNTGNPNIDAAAASAYYQQQTAQMKFEHQMQLQQARQNAQTPANQPYGGGVTGSIPGIDADLAAVGRSIFGTGLRA
tara:strand:- start:10 stop:801 length:792 start_codon:yes stop_codon:yes gene_type:complete